QGRKARVGLLRNDAAAAGAVIEIFQDHAGIEQHRAVFEQQRRNLAERILLPQRVARTHRVGGRDGDLALEPEHAYGDLDLAYERRGRRVTERQHGRCVIDGRRFGPAAARQIGPRAREARARGQPVTTRFTAFGPLPFLSGSTSKEMRCPSVSDLSPARSTAVTWTKTSRPPSSGLMKP